MTTYGHIARPMYSSPILNCDGHPCLKEMAVSIDRGFRITVDEPNGIPDESSQTRRVAVFAMANFQPIFNP
jgi:hypothetical protein